MKPNISSAVSLVLVLSAASSLVSMISVLKIDSMVHGDLYRYGLQFSYQWAMPYWTLTTLVFGMGWFNIIIAIAFQFYVLIWGRKESWKADISKEVEPQLQPTKEEIIEAETKPAEKTEEHQQSGAQPYEEVLGEPEIQTVVEATSQAEQTETTQVEEVEGQREQEAKPTEQSQVETETPTPTETQQETAEKSEENPQIADETPQQVGA